MGLWGKVGGFSGSFEVHGGLGVDDCMSCSSCVEQWTGGWVADAMWSISWWAELSSPGF